MAEFELFSLVVAVPAVQQSLHWSPLIFTPFLPARPPSVAEPFFVLKRVLNPSSYVPDQCRRIIQHLPT